MTRVPRMSAAEVAFRKWAKLDEVQRAEFDILRKGAALATAKPAAPTKPRKPRTSTVAAEISGAEG